MMKRLLSFVLLCSALSKGYSQTHTYQFNSSFAGTGPTLTEVVGIAPCVGVPGSFSSQTITTSACSRGPQQTFAFNANDGVSYPNVSGLGITGIFTIHILYKMPNYNAGSFSFQKLIDFSNGTSDDGLYTNNSGGASLVNVIAVSPHDIAALPNPTGYQLISVTRDGAGIVNIYADGNMTPLITYDDHLTNVYTSVGGVTPIIFFRDDITAANPCESAAGFVRYISLTNGAQTPVQIQAAWLNLCAAVLPVSLTDFAAQKNANSIALQWQTSNEINAAYYNVERSYDGQTFTAIAKVNAKNATSNSYAYTDLSGISLTSSNTYYRLQSVDVNGNYKYSSIVRIANGKDSKVTLFPNPATNFVTISGLNNKDEIRLLSIDGKVLSQQTNSGAQSMIMSIEKYKPGTYIIQVKNDTEVSQQKFVKY